MSLIVLIFGIWCLISISRFGTARTFLTVVLPVMMLVPCAFFLRLPHLPPLNIEDSVLGSLGIGMLLYDIRRWRFTTLDLWIAVFICTAAYSERIPWGTNGAWLRFVTAILQCLVPYMAGKLLLEQPGMRLKSTQTLVRFMTIACIFAIPQFVSKKNLYLYFWEHFFPGQWLPIQTRMEFGRVSGPYGGAESAGMTILIGLLLAAWLQHGRQLLPLKYAKTSIFILVLSLLMTQSRGPWLGAIIAFAVASIGRAAKPGRRAVLIFSLFLGVGVPLYSAFENYTSGKRTEYGSAQETAQYRKELIANFIPIAEAGGAWGWGDSFPHPDGQNSLDNEYLLIWLLQGYVGAISLVLIIGETTFRYTRLGSRARAIRERYFILTLLGIVVGLAFTFTTVWMSDQDYLLFFLIPGWSQSIRPGQSDSTDSSQSDLRRELQFHDSILVYT
jgi:hypothetical protein